MASNNLHRMATEIRRKQELAAGLDRAKRRQKVMLPHMPELAGFEFASIYEPAADISGDFYDFVNLADNRLGIIVGDVTGHGIEAAIVMGMAKKSLSIFARSSLGPKDALSLGNDDLCDDLDSDTFLTVVYAVLDADSNRLILARAGHTKTIIFNPKRDEPFTEIDSQGMMLGMLKGKSFANTLTEASVELLEGDVILFYTDGLTEARNLSGQMFELDGIQDVLKKHSKHSPSRVLSEMTKALRDFTGGEELEDDITMIALKRKVSAIS